MRCGIGRGFLTRGRSAVSMCRSICDSMKRPLESFSSFPSSNFALAAPVTYWYKRNVDMVHTPKDVITVLEKQGFED
jgi:hypothetical protein